MKKLTSGAKKISRELKSEKETAFAGLIISSLVMLWAAFTTIVKRNEDPLFSLLLAAIAATAALIPARLQRRFPHRSAALLLLAALVLLLAPVGLGALFIDKLGTFVTLPWVVLLTFCAQVYFRRRREHRILDRLLRSGWEIKLPNYLPIRSCSLAVELTKKKEDSIILKAFYYSTQSKQRNRITVNAYFGDDDAFIPGGSDSAVYENMGGTHTTFVFLGKNEVKKPNISLGTGIDTKVYYRLSGVDYEVWSYGISKDKLEKVISSMS